MLHSNERKRRKSVHLGMDPKYFIVGYIISQSKVISARKRLVLRCLNLIDDNMNKYAQIINLEKWLERVSNYNMLDAGIGDVND